MRKNIKMEPMDAGLMTLVIALLIVGVLLVFDASYSKTGDAKWANYDIWYMVKRQVIYAIFGLGLMFVVARVRLEYFKKMALPLAVVVIGLLVAVLVAGDIKNGACRWLSYGPVNIQPSELAKVAIVLFLASFLAERGKKVRRINREWIFPILVVMSIAGLVFIQPDMGTAVTIVTVCLVMLYASGALKRHVVGIIGALAGLAYLAIAIAPYRMQRIEVWLDPWQDPYGSGYQLIHSLIALGTGGLAGVGLCEGREKLYIPAASTDFIFATLSEETGLIGGVVVLGLFVFLAYRGFDVANRAKSSYASLLAVGVTAMISIQAVVNVAVVSASIPATGVPLPFISYGGSSLVATLVAMGILLSVSRQINIEIDEKNEDSTDRWRDGGTRLSRYQHRSGNKANSPTRRTAVHR